MVSNEVSEQGQRKYLRARLGALPLKDRAKVLRLMIAHNAVSTMYRAILATRCQERSNDDVSAGDQGLLVCLGTGVTKEAIDAFRDCMPWFKTKRVLAVAESKRLFAAAENIKKARITQIRDDAAFHWRLAELEGILADEDFILNPHGVVASIGREGKLNDCRYVAGDVAHIALAWGANKAGWKAAMEEVRNLQEAILKVFPVAIEGKLSDCEPALD